MSGIECPWCEFEVPDDEVYAPGDRCPVCIEGRLREQEPDE